MAANKILNLEPIPLTTSLNTNLLNCAMQALAPPVQAAATTSVSGGTLAAATYSYVITALSAAGETPRSNEQSIATTGAASSNTLTWAAVPGASSYKVYRGTGAGLENVFYSLGNVTTFLDTGAANTVGAPPVLNTALAGPIGFILTQPYLLIRHMRIANKLGSAQTFSLWKGASGANLAGTEIGGTQKSVPPNDGIDLVQLWRFDAFDYLVGGASVNSALTLVLDGEIGFA